MCTHPTTIINPKLKSKHSAFNPGIDPVILKVPCGKCRQCQLKKQQDILVRLAYEYEYTKRQGGFVLFDTLTMNDEYIPKWHGLMCFNRDYISIFMKKLRIYLNRWYEEECKKITITKQEKEMHLIWDGETWNKTEKTKEYEVKNKEAYAYQADYGNNQVDDEAFIEQRDFNAQRLDNELYEINIDLQKKWPIYPNKHPRGKIKIFLVCEYGGEFGRPHYHVLFFITFDIEPIKFREYVRKAWIYGFTDKRHISKMVVQNFAAISYVSKYVCKDIEYINTITKQKNSTFMPYFEKRWEQLYNETFDYKKLQKMPCEVVKKLMNDIGMNEAIPFNVWSKGLGLYALQKIDERDIMQGEMTVRDKNKAWKRVAIPEYIKRKLYYDYDKMIKYWQLNEKGKIRKANQVEHTIQRTIINCDIIFKQQKIVGINNDYKEKLYDIVYNDIHLYNELITTIVNRDKMITEEFEQLLKKKHTWEEITMEEYMNGIENVSLTSKHEPHTWIYYRLKYDKGRGLNLVNACNEQVQELIRIYNEGIKQRNEEYAQRLNTRWRAERIQKNIAQGGTNRL